MLSLPTALDFPCYIKMEGITTLIAPIPYLMNDASTPLVGIESGSLHDWPFLNQTVVISNAAHEGRSRPQFSPNLRCRLKQLFITLKVRKGVVHAHASVKITVRNFSQIQHVRDEQLNIQTPLCSFHTGPFN